MTTRDPSVKDYFRLIQQRRRLVYTVIGACLFVSLILSFTLPERYQVELQLYPLGAPDVFSLTQSQTTVRKPVTPMISEEISNTHIALMKTTKMMELIAEEVPERSTGQLGRSIDADLDVQSSLFKITVSDKDPEIAAKIANVFGDKINELYGELSLVPTTNTRHFIEEEIEKKKSEVDKAREAMEAFQLQHKIISMDKEVEWLVNTRTNLRTRIDENGIRLREMNETIVAIGKQMGEEASLYTYEEMIASDPIISNLQSRLSELEVSLAVKLTEMTDLHPEIIRHKAEIETVKEELRNEIDRLASSQTKTPGSFYETLRQRMVGLIVDKLAVREEIMASKDLIEKIEKKLEGFPTLIKEFSDLTMELRRQEGVYTVLHQRLEEIIIQEERDQKMFVPIEPVDPPTSPYFPSITVNLVVGFVFGFSGSVIYILFLSYLDRVKEARLEETRVYALLSESEEQP